MPSATPSAMRRRRGQLSSASVAGESFAACSTSCSEPWEQYSAGKMTTQERKQLARICRMRETDEAYAMRCLQQLACAPDSQAEQQRTGKRQLRQEGEDSPVTMAGGEVHIPMNCGFVQTNGREFKAPRALVEPAALRPPTHPSTHCSQAQQAQRCKAAPRAGESDNAWATLNADKRGHKQPTHATFGCRRLAMTGHHSCTGDARVRTQCSVAQDSK